MVTTARGGDGTPSPSVQEMRRRPGLRGRLAFFGPAFVASSSTAAPPPRSPGWPPW
ncbi:hypothetical protein ACFFTK_21395 [Pseudonocardia petroleophila]|uniref:Uncharacterized protein n=1 Tax=Pseudonocardia petroleophila TaxID=37331 RepID=A0A7G7MI79_9PSEU|nr:hypothetical protein [Pseudonocardia petroleophila]QNG52490.1 hypothetical protein H6H00_31545 [Pseudonocardia petroleophila]